jgi:hypothetical protein
MPFIQLDRELLLELNWQCGLDDCIASKNFEPRWLHEYQELTMVPERDKDSMRTCNTI